MKAPFMQRVYISAWAEVCHVITKKFQPGWPSWNFSPGWNSPCDRAFIVLCEMVLCTVCETNEICTLRNENLYFAKWKSVLCEMEICTLRNGNLYFARWKSVLCEMKLLLSNFMKNFRQEASANLVFTYNHDRDTACLTQIASAKLVALCFLHHCFRLLVDRLCFVLLRDDYINLISPRHQHDPNNSEGSLGLFVELILRDGSVQWKNVLFEYISYLVPGPCFACPASTVQKYQTLA